MLITSLGKDFWETSGDWAALCKLLSCYSTFSFLFKGLSNSFCLRNLSIFIISTDLLSFLMTRSRKLQGGEEHLPRYFAKNGFVDADPKKTKKDGGGKANWSGEEVHDYGYTFANARRRSNSSNQALEDFKTKFEAIEHDPVFEEDIHGPEQTDTETCELKDQNSGQCVSIVGRLHSDTEKRKGP
ncbi:hypothetical protein D8B26_006894 [Coccidioides posadasii str. Silveira]|uniref:Uncharacterized protein n=1 Tax=Coccidioides posadasii (strain C735) TaxID=222929 RepID=C5P672_COCP7|nr:hypothetical protein CPC735_035480 [Coccidioides posadasii C735 delta SOWgp]EER28212.1 hypothetical protein CPC735_035480 [Coccidioides posadasii C735 delta SOWgp]QVM12263.1 hypothetical protein D8B26_006894 [Coccidioides posadasii str. Silveira]|eukprot:XP_003070357.1 hypothetical protein CPC735_035480 [Coccidioides posadasii C735 delta SOWgp]